VATVLTSAGPLEGLRAAVSRFWVRSASLWRAYPRESVGIALLALVALVTALSVTVVGGTHPVRPAAAPPAPPPMVVRPLAPEQAIKVNAAIPISAGPNPAAAPFLFKGNATTHAQALNCLASAVYYEAGNQDVDGERAVAQVVLNRVRHPAFPASICGVVYEGSTRPTGCQFTFTCDGSLNRQPDAEGWRRAMQVAQAALAGFVYAPVGWATHYHANYVVPVWAATLAKSDVVGAHLFYRWAGAWGQPAAFTESYSGREPNADALRKAALATPHVTPIYGQGQLAQAIKTIPGAEPLKLKPSLRGDKRVAVRFNLVARSASDAVKHEDYVKQFGASDNLKWSLSSDTVAENQKPLGRAPAASSSVPAVGQR
jgi:spore germination cell wall hydrolase CwlJ-like protein